MKCLGFGAKKIDLDCGQVSLPTLTSVPVFSTNGRLSLDHRCTVHAIPHLTVRAVHAARQASLLESTHGAFIHLPTSWRKGIEARMPSFNLLAAFHWIKIHDVSRLKELNGAIPLT
jgi:hypothetical protein